MKSRLIKISKLRIMFIILSIACMVMIFMFSMENSDESSATSGRFVKLVIKIFCPEFSEYSVIKQNEITDILTFFIRKLAHFSIYTFLGLCMSLSEGSHRLLSKKSLVPFILGVLYATSDEIHQSFSPGRSCELRDVCIDSCGVMTGILISIVIIAIRNALKKKRSTQEQIERTAE